ncbi:MAG: hypothetical protein WBG46_09865 [Nonlabens sp.]
MDLETEPILVPAVIDADKGTGYEYINNSWVNILVDDDISANTYSLIIAPMMDDCTGYTMSIHPVIAAANSINIDCHDIFAGGSGGGSPGGGTSSNLYTGSCTQVKPVGNYVRQVFVGRTKLKKQYDRKISFTGNGGGSEIRYCRVDSKESIQSDSLGNYSVTQWDVRVSQYWSRKQIRRENVRNAAILWDPNWECQGEHEQLFVIYEEDTEGDLTIDQDLSFDLADNSYGADIDITIQNRSKDDAIILRTREQVEFFTVNLLNDMGGGCFNGRNSFADRCWPIYDSGSNMPYTMYHRWVLVQ